MALSPKLDSPTYLSYVQRKRDKRCGCDKAKVANRSRFGEKKVGIEENWVRSSEKCTIKWMTSWNLKGQRLWNFKIKNYEWVDIEVHDPLIYIPDSRQEESQRKNILEDGVKNFGKLDKRTLPRHKNCSLIRDCLR